MLNKAMLKRIDEGIKANSQLMSKISDFLFLNPELGGEEFVSSAYLKEVAREKGFEVTENYCGWETGFLAQFKNGEGPVIGFITEFDALPGFGPGGGPGHACGHNWIAGGAFGAAMALAECKELFSGTIRIIGTPAMENLGAKSDMIKEGAFDDVDLVIQFHLEKYTSVEIHFLAMDALEFTFKGRASHASAYPEGGINALDAVNFTFMGLNALKNHLRSDVKIHGVITKGGDSPSTITEVAACRFYVRARDRRYLESITPRIKRCAEGAALMAGAELTASYFENPEHNVIPNSVLQEMAIQYMEREEIYISDDYEVEHSSSDIGGVSYVVPTLYVEIGADCAGDFRVHHESAMHYVNTNWAKERMVKVARIMASIALEVLTDEEGMRAVKKEHAKALASEGGPRF